MGETELTAVLPVYNDRAALERAIPVSLEVLETCADRFDPVVAEDGSTDGSAEFVARLDAPATPASGSSTRTSGSGGEGH